MQSVKQIVFPLLVVLISFICIVPLFHTGFFPIHDNTQVARVFEMHDSIRDGMIPVRWVNDLGYGYGYPIFTFYAPLAYYIGALFMIFGFPALIATKIMIGIGFTLAGLCMYFLAREFWGEKGGLVSGVLYALAPYHGVNLYVRGAISEMWAYAFVPLAFYGVWKISQARSKTAFLLGSFGVAGVILSHNLTAMMILPFVALLALILAIVNKKQGRRSLLPIAVLVVGLLLSAFYWLPAVTELGLTNVALQAGGGSDYKDHFVCLSQLWTSQAGFGGSAPGCVDGISLQLGKIHIIILASSLVLSVIFRKKKSVLYVLIASQIISVLGIFFMIDISKPVWDLLSPMKYFQFPWRFQSLFLLGSSLVAGSFFQLKITFIKKRSMAGAILTTILVVSTFALYQKFFVPQSYINRADLQQEKFFIRSVTSRISDEYMSKEFRRPEIGEFVSSSFYPTTNVQVAEVVDKSMYKSATITQLEQGEYIANIGYFPGWKVQVDTKHIEAYSNKGRLAFELPEGVSHVEITYASTMVEKMGNALSLGGICILAIAIIAMKKRKKAA